MTQLQTGVDELMNLVQERKKISVPDAAKALKVPERTLQSWVDFLVEEHILGIEYKFTTPYIYVHSEERLRAIQDKKEYTLKEFKDTFEKRAQTQGMPEDKIPSLWKEHLRFVANQQKGYFIEECKRRGVKEAEQLFNEYLEELTNGIR